MVPGSPEGLNAPFMEKKTEETDDLPRSSCSSSALYSLTASVPECSERLTVSRVTLVPSETHQGFSDQQVQNPPKTVAPGSRYIW